MEQRPLWQEHSKQALYSLWQEFSAFIFLHISHPGNPQPYPFTVGYMGLWPDNFILFTNHIFPAILSGFRNTHLKYFSHQLKRGVRTATARSLNALQTFLEKEALILLYLERLRKGEWVIMSLTE